MTDITRSPPQRGQPSATRAFTPSSGPGTPYAVALGQWVGEEFAPELLCRTGMDGGAAAWCGDSGQAASPGSILAVDLGGGVAGSGSRSLGSVDCVIFGCQPDGDVIDDQVEQGSEVPTYMSGSGSRSG
ncbi:hypothetical protein [Nocardia miyunensis]|uniref:hypothetical protein n=1 Tax=Nocardia miyunensis TaxID=282684 RepID=UPI0012F4CE4D|nr:hypothetical protein [Nocardia miyunensis]